MSATAWKSRPSAKTEAAKSFGGDILSLAHVHPDSQHRRTTDVPQGGHLFAAKWAQFERVATELMDDFDAARYSRASLIATRNAQREAELNNPEEAKHWHSISVSCDQRAELIRTYPGEFTETMAVLADIFSEKREAA